MRTTRLVAISHSLTPWVGTVALAAACSGGEFRLAEELPVATVEPAAGSPSAAGSMPEHVSEPIGPSVVEPESTSDSKQPRAAPASSPAVSTTTPPGVESEPTAPGDPTIPAATPDAGSGSAPDDAVPASDGGLESEVDADVEPDDSSPESPTNPEPELEPFSFFVTSFAAMQALSGSDQGFGGDLRYGEATGLAGADKICSEIAEISMPGASAKGWRAFLSAAFGPDGSRVDAIDRIGEGPWYDRLGRLVALDLNELIEDRPRGDEAISSDLPNEFGESSRTVAGVETAHQDVLTGSDDNGEWSGQTCADWTSTTVAERPNAGHPWATYSTDHWIDAHTAPGCAASVGNGDGGYWGPGSGGGSWGGLPYVRGGGVGDNGGYGAIYCFALSE